VVIGADGVNSKLREAVVGPSQSRFSGAVAHRAIYPSRLLAGMQIRNCTKWWGPNSHILIYYIEQSRDEIYLVTSAKGEWHSQASWEFCPREEVLNAFAGFHSEVRTVIETAPQLTKWPILDVEPVDTWSKGRLVLLGDACHAMMPYMAAGAGMAMEDAAVLQSSLFDLPMPHHDSQSCLSQRLNHRTSCVATEDSFNKIGPERRKAMSAPM
jgi:6-hydroxynicotinate 3-monooxygenase